MRAWIAGLAAVALSSACGGDDFASGGSAGAGGGAAGASGGASGGAAGASGGAAGATGGAAGGPGGGSGSGGVAGNSGGAAGSSGGSAGSGGTGGSGGGSTGGSAGSSGTGGAVGDAIGCSDGTREGFGNMGTHPNIAACAGGWSVPGLTSPASMSPACGRVSGNSSTNPNGTGCSVEDLCSAGWRVCASAAEVGQRSGTGGCDSNNMSSGFYVTRQGASTSAGLDCTPTGVNNLAGCGNSVPSATVPASCAPLSHVWQFSQCTSTFNSWNCTNMTAELSDVTKADSSLGGVVCCRMSGN